MRELLCYIDLVGHTTSSEMFNVHNNYIIETHELNWDKYKMAPLNIVLKMIIVAGTDSLYTCCMILREHLLFHAEVKWFMEGKGPTSPFLIVIRCKAIPS